MAGTAQGSDEVKFGGIFNGVKGIIVHMVVSILAIVGTAGLNYGLMLSDIDENRQRGSENTKQIGEINDNIAALDIRMTRTETQYEGLKERHASFEERIAADVSEIKDMITNLSGKLDHKVDRRDR